MSKPSEEISKNNANSNGKTDANLANDSNNLGGIPAEQYATLKYVQNYHDAKELDIREDMNSGNMNVLRQAKAYTDTVVQNQDFSNFAKVPDLQALDNRLSEQIAQCGINCENKMNTKIEAVVEDVNGNFDDVNNAINTINQNQQQLFTSVSNGKRKIAAAITDKGVNTASDASFDVMATNIRAIESGGGQEYDENFVNTADGTATASDIGLGKTAYVKGQKLYGTHTDLNTSDATATASDILSGATAYVDGQKITGTYEPLDTSDATATASDILTGKTAYSNGVKLTGTCNPIPEYPTYGTDTSNATATSSEIASGKTAYVGGQLIVGSFAGNSNVEEVYGVNVGGYDIQEGSLRYIQEPNSEHTVTARKILAFSKDNRYCVSLATLNNGTEVIDSNLVTENGLVIQSSTGISSDTVYKKYRYSKAELGLSDESIVNIALGSPGLGGHNSLCLLIIQTYYQSKYYFHLYTYHLYENGVIGRESNNDSFVLDNYVLDGTGTTLYAANTDPTIFFAMPTGYGFSLVRYYFSITVQSGGNCDVNLTSISTTTKVGNNNWQTYSDKALYVAPDDSYIWVARRSGENEGLILLDEHLYVTNSIGISPRNNSSYYETGLIEPNTSKIIRCRPR